MSLYGIDILAEEKDETKLWLGEINGVTSGTYPFRELYGDRRVEKKICRMLEEKYGALQLLVPNQARKIVNKKRPGIVPQLKILGIDEELWTLAESVDEMDRLLRTHPLAERLLDEEVVDETEKYREQMPYPDYEKLSDKAVINAINLQVPQRTVNSFVAEALTRNKLLQYQALRKSSIKKNMPLTAMVGLGSCDIDELTRLSATGDKFIKKPLRGSQCEGVQVIDNLERYEGESGLPIFTREVKLKVKGEDVQIVEGAFLPDLILRGNLLFDRYTAILQQFIDTRKFSERFGEGYSCIRAVVCNGQFVDAFIRVSDNPAVSCSTGARVVLARGIRGLREFSQRVVRELESRAEQLKPHNYNIDPYLEYLTIFPRTLDLYDPHRRIVSVKEL